MTVRQLKPGLLLSASALAALALVGCGRQGALERPRPLFGRESTPSPQAVTRTQAAARARNEARAMGDPRAPQSVDEVRELGLSPVDEAHSTDVDDAQRTSTSAPPAPPP